MLIGDNSLAWWDLADLTSSGRIILTGPPARQFVVLSNGRAIMLTNDGLLEVRRLVDGVVERTAPVALAVGQTDLIEPVAVSADGHILGIEQPFLAASIDGRVLLITLGSGEHVLIRVNDLSEISRLPGLSGVALLQDGTFLAGNQNGALQLYRTETGALIRDLAVGHAGVIGLAFSPDGTRLVSAGKSVLRVWDVAQGQLLRTVEDGNLTYSTGCFGFSPSGRLLASCAPGQQVQLWDSQTWKLQATLGSPPSGGEGQNEATGLAFDPEEITVLVADSAGTLSQWRISDGMLLHTIQAHKGSVVAMVQGHTPESVVTVGMEGTVKEWAWPNLTHINSGHWHYRTIFSPFIVIPGGTTIVQTEWPQNTIIVSRIEP